MYELTDLDTALSLVRRSEWPFYVYVLARPNGEIFYVGKGQDRRLTNHTQPWVCENEKNYKQRVVNKILAAGDFPKYGIDSFHREEDSVFARERELIALFGRKHLTNLTDGGEGLSNPTDEVRERKRSMMRSRMMDIEHRAKAVGALLSKDVRAKSAAAIKDYWSKPSSIEMAKVRNKKRCERPEELARMHRMREEYWNTDISREEASRRAQDRWKDEELRERMTANIAARSRTPEFRAWASENGKKVGAMPHVKEAKARATKERMADPSQVAIAQRNLRTPEAIARKSESQKKNNALRRLFRMKCDVLQAEYAIESKRPNPCAGYRQWEAMFRRSLAEIGVLDG